MGDIGNQTILPLDLFKGIKLPKKSNTVFNVAWRIKERARAYTPKNKSCNLCTSEIYHILFNPQDATLNSRNEFKGHCRHWQTHRLSNLKT